MKIEKNAIEWSVFAVSALIVGACLGALVVMIAREGNAPPSIVVSVGPAERNEAGYLVPVRARNDGDETAEEVRVEVTLESGGREVEKGELTVAFVPRHSEREGFVVFGRDPACCRIRARAISFERP
jgi:uncharacterized protein (TIGR02588 family)